MNEMTEDTKRAKQQKPQRRRNIKIETKEPIKSPEIIDEKNTANPEENIKKLEKEFKEVNDKISNNWGSVSESTADAWNEKKIEINQTLKGKQEEKKENKQSSGGVYDFGLESQRIEDGKFKHFHFKISGKIIFQSKDLNRTEEYAKAKIISAINSSIWDEMDIETILVEESNIDLLGRRR